MRGKTVGKGVDKLIAQNGGEKLPIPVLDQWNTFCGVNAPKASALLGVFIRRMAPIKNVPTWRHIDEATQSAIIQAILDKFKISDDYPTNQTAQKAMHEKCYRIHINWRYNMKRHYLQLLKDGEDAYGSPYDNMTLEDWRHMIDDVWASDKHMRKSEAGQKNRGKLGPGGHCSGSRSFVAGMTTPPEDNGFANLEFPEFYEKMHTKKDKTWIDDICAENHSKMVSKRQESTESGVQFTSEEMSVDVLGKRKRCILGFGVGPKPTSSSLKTNVASQERDEELQNYKATMEKMRMEHEEERREREEERRKHEEEMRQHNEERIQQEAAQKKLEDRLRILEEKSQANSSPIHHGGHISSISTRRESEKERRQHEEVQKNREDLLLLWQKNAKTHGSLTGHGGRVSSTFSGSRKAR